MTRSGRRWRVQTGMAVERAELASLHVDRPRTARRPSAADQLEMARQAAYDEGYQAGLEAARENAQVARDEAVRRGAEALGQAASAIRAGRVNALAVVEQDVANLAVELTRTLVDHELSVSDEEVSSTVRRALQLVTAGEDITVRLHPDELVEAEVLQPLVADCRITVVADPTVAPGGCIVDSGPSRIDAQIAPALERVRSALMGGRDDTETLDEQADRTETASDGA